MVEGRLHERSIKTCVTDAENRERPMFWSVKSFIFLWMASLSLMVCTLNGSSAQNPASVPTNYQNTKSCDQGKPGSGFDIGQYRYKLTSEIFQPTMDLYQRIQDMYGANAEIVDWDTIKSLLQEFEVRREFIKEVGIPLQGYNFLCGNILIFKSGGNNINGFHYLLARHDGLRPNDWLILDTIGQNELHLGRWNHYGRVLIRIKGKDLGEPDVTVNTQPPLSESLKHLRFKLRPNRSQRAYHSAGLLSLWQTATINPRRRF